MARRLRLGILSDEFFEPSVGRLGEFGWATCQVARLFQEDATLGRAADDRDEQGIPVAITEAMASGLKAFDPALANVPGRARATLRCRAGRVDTACQWS